MYHNPISIEQVNVLFSTNEAGLFIKIDSLEDKNLKENSLCEYLKEHQNNDSIQLAVISSMDPILSEIAIYIHKKLIEYGFYDMKNIQVVIRSVRIMSQYTILVVFEKQSI